ncbi:uncharacterized protein LOC114356140 [Ostrinia furnacalis]|uniref:uncharacterized protein LOC114356140 n=1 Tax=Ostrinia furnacalis TaxID=93504 RepID=UPI00103F4CC1|nr:uncharacterized protein LOC114356140 [Ostrinia furnacalis]
MSAGLVFVQADHDLVVNKVIPILKRRDISEEPALSEQSEQESAEDLPDTEPEVPGHTLIQPEEGMLQSSQKYPQDSVGRNVYGNLGQLSITYGKTPQRILYTGFRKANSLLESTILQAIVNIQKQNRDKDVIVIEIGPPYERQFASTLQKEAQHKSVSDEENNASEILDESSSLESEDNDPRRTNNRYKYRDRDKLHGSTSSETSNETESESDSSDYDKNPGNPYTLHKEKYKQNYLWNHFMDGNHMNINPSGPMFGIPGPNGVDLFFGRKWWYFNQDDYKPLR